MITRGSGVRTVGLIKVCASEQGSLTRRNVKSSEVKAGLLKK